jgi:hypothetical protein
MKDSYGSLHGRPVGADAASLRLRYPSECDVALIYINARLAPAPRGLCDESAPPG